MKRILSMLLLGLVATAGLTNAAYAQSEYYELAGSYVVGVTLNYDTQSVTWHHSDGTQFTQVNVDFKAVVLWVQQQAKQVDGG